MKAYLSLLFLTFALGFYLLLPSNVQAQANFSTQLKTIYQVNQAGVTHVSHQFEITNLTPTKYIDKYALNLNFTHLKNIQAKAGKRKLNPHVVEADKQTSIALDFHQPVIGQGQKRQFTIEYDSKHLAEISGNVLEINIPKVSGTSYHRRIVEIIVPNKFQQANYIQPQPTKIEHRNNETVLQFDNLGNHSVMAIFGNEQLFDLTLRYNLVNHSQSNSLAQITLPPDTRYQQVYYHSLNPPPIKLTRDDDGNWLATYQLDPSETKTIYASLTAKLTIKPNQLSLPPLSLEKNLASEKYWPVGASIMKKIVSQHPDIAQIYQYSVDTLHYTDKLDRHHRLGAIGALKKPHQAACEEFSDLFITLARTAGIPARRLTGYAYTNNNQLKPLSLAGDTLHAWAEFYDRQKRLWRQVDPTWQSTTGGRDYFHYFDLNHLVFAINGENSILPLPAGSYVDKQTNKTKNIVVDLAQRWPKIKPDFSFNLKQTGLHLPNFYQLEIKNETGAAWYQVKLVLQSNKKGLKIIRLNQLNPIFLPFAKQKINLLIFSPDWQPHRVKLSPVIYLTKNRLSKTTLKTKVLALPTLGLETKTKNQLIAIGLGVSAIVVLLIFGTITVIKKR